MLPEGDDVFVIKKFDKGRYDGGDKRPPCPKAIVTFSVYNDGQCVDIQENFLASQENGMEVVRVLFIYRLKEER